MKKLISVLLILCIVPAMFAGCGAGEKLDWDNLMLGKLLPEIETTSAHVFDNDNDGLNIIIDDFRVADYNEYVAACEGKGFMVDPYQDGEDYVVYNAEGYKLTLGYSSLLEQLDLELDTPIEMVEFGWPASGIAAQLPATSSKYGQIEINDAEWFDAYIGKTSKQDFVAYVDACIQSGFSVDYQKDERCFEANNAEGFTLTVTYEGFDTIYISLEAPEKVEETTQVTTTDTPTTEPTQATLAPETDGVSAAFKETMDAYEAYFDEYIAFMEKYKANPSDLSLLADYAEFMSSYASMMEKMSALGDQEMTTAEAAYYLEVTTRINQKLLKVAE